MPDKDEMTVDGLLNVMEKANKAIFRVTEAYDKGDRAELKEAMEDLKSHNQVLFTYR